MNGPLSQALQSVGIRVCHHPVLVTAPPPSWKAFDAAWLQRQQVDWVGFTSQRAVRWFSQRLATLGGNLAELSHCKIACIGPSTAETWVALGGQLPLVPEVSHAEALGEAILQTGIASGHCCWLPQALQAREALGVLLREAGIKILETPTYQILSAPSTASRAWREILGQGVDWITFASPSAVEHWFNRLPPSEWLQLTQRPRIACIGPSTAVAVRELSLSVDVTATSHNFAGLADAIVHFPKDQNTPVS
ncbi:MAG: uroporphyrinogen-III synthase [Deltaproteobacteria bacterium]|nr:uroporphyrinogen-III synthase [Deltaproteobacteria bacterium]